MPETHDHPACPPAPHRPGSPLVSICVSCRAKTADAPPPGPAFERFVALALAERAVDADVRPVQCLSVCSRAATVAVQAADGYAFLFGDLEGAADAAALAATDEGARRIYDEGLGTDLPLDDALVQQTAAEHLASRGRPHGLEGWSVAPGTGSPDGRTAVVRLTGQADLPLVGGLLESLGGSVTVTVESRARAAVRTAP